MAEQTPGTSGTIQTKETVEKYKSTDKAIIMSPEGKLIPFRTLAKITNDDEDRKEDKNNPDLPKYKYIL